MKKGVRTIFCFAQAASRNSQKNSSDPFVGFSLLEVVLALAILAGALAALGEVMRMGDQNAAAATDESQAEMLAESVMSELLVGARPLAAVNNASLAIESEPPWVLSIAVDQTEFKELVAVRVRVAQQLASQLQPAHCDLVRWFPNPDYLPAANQESNTTSGDSSSASSSSSLGGGQP
jgi:type II secretion system protein I